MSTLTDKQTIQEYEDYISVNGIDENIMNNFIMSIILALIAGIMLYIALYDLLKEAIKSKKYQLTITFFIIGILFMITSHFILS